MHLAVVSLFIAGAVAFAGTPVAKVTSAEPFRIGNTTVPVAGIPNWPLVDGDEVTLSKAPAEVAFADGSRLFLLPGSKFRLDADGPRVQLTEGGLAYKFTKDSSVTLAVVEEQVPTRSREGRVMALQSTAYWDPYDVAFALGGDDDSRRRQDEDAFNNSRLTPFNLDLVNRWRDYHPPFGNPPGENPPEGEVPPELVVNPPELRPVSNWRP